MKNQDEIDLTPMVDVTFLLLIFFMVTASFMLQSSIEQPQASNVLPGPVEPIGEDQIHVTIDQNNTFHVSSPGAPETEAPSVNEMRAMVKDAVENLEVTRMTILAHVDSRHAKLVTAWDAGAINGVQQMEIKTTAEDF